MAEQIIDNTGNGYGMAVNSDGSININDSSTQLIQKIDYEDKMQPIYMGWAEAGTSTGSPNWQIRKNTFSGTQPELITGVLFGSGNTNFDKTWENRSGTNESYS